MSDITADRPVSGTSPETAEPAFWKTAAVLAVVVLVGRFLFASRFYLYEDDWFMYGHHLNECSGGIGRFASFVFGQIVGFPQGRPLGFALPAALSCSIGQFGLLPLYGLGFVIHVLVCWLFFRLVTLMSCWQLGLVAAIMAALQPFDTTASFYTHIAQLQVALLAAMAACILLLRGRPSGYLGSGILIFVALNFYEAPAVIVILPILYLLFSGFWRRAGLSAAVMAPVFAGYGVLRVFSHEARVSGSFGPGALELTLQNYGRLAAGMAAIPRHVVRVLAATPFYTSFGIALLLTALIAFVVFRRFRLFPSQVSISRHRPLVFAAVALALVGLIPFCLYGEVWPHLGGRTGRFFSCSLFGIAIVGSWLLLSLGRLRHGGVAAGAIFSGLVFAQASYGLVLQRQLVDLGREQVLLYHDMMRPLADVGPDIDTMFIGTDFAVQDYDGAMTLYTWAIDELPGWFFTAAPRLSWVIMQPDKPGALQIEGETLAAGRNLVFTHQWTAPLRVGRIAVVEWSRGAARRLDSYKVDGVEIAKPAPPDADAWATQDLTPFGHMFQSWWQLESSRAP